MIDILLLLILLGVTWSVANEGPFGAAITFFCVIFAGLLTMNFFEPFATFLQTRAPRLGDWFDFIAFVGLFALFTFLFRMVADQIAPSSIVVADVLYQPLRWIFGFGAGYVTMAILLTSLHTSMLPREFIGFKPERQNFFSISAPDRQWLAFTQHVTENLLSRRQPFLRADKVRDVGVRMFDGAIFPVPEKTQILYLPTFVVRYASRRERALGPSLSAPQPTSTGPARPAAGF